MPKNEDGEFELILANRQLLSVFFIVVVLLGVFFTMGYIVGRNSGPAPVDVASARKPESKPIVVESPAPQDTAAPTPTPAAAAPTSTQPQREADAPKPEPRREEPVAKKESPAKKEKEKPAPVSAPPASGQTYLQLVATAKAEADVMVDVLHQKQFKAIAVEIPEKPGLFRVLVGPLADGTLNKVKSDLTSSGFPGDKAIKKVY
ncbi:MAG TPA: SPOR domain-containing protein [Bryobacteraceae bacterium]|nr:SPOR domain-containing protein [Bryobacteraceae bacterium]